MTTPGPQIRVFPTAHAVAEEAARLLQNAARRAVTARGRFTLALSGGRTPRALYALLAQAGRDALPYGRMEIFWGDERAVPPDDPESNYRLAWEAWLSRAPLATERVHRIRGEVHPDTAAAEYEAEIRRVLGDPPRFDLILLGIGPDGHTASLFPHDPALDSDRLVIAVTAPFPPRPRVTFTFRLIEAARRVLLLAIGEDKAEAVRGALRNPPTPEIPTSRLRRHYALWLLDEAAAVGLQ